MRSGTNGRTSEQTAQERDRYRAALERIAGPTDRPFLGHDGKLAAQALGRVAATSEEIAARARSDYDHYVQGVIL